MKQRRGCIRNRCEPQKEGPGVPWHQAITKHLHGHGPQRAALAPVLYQSVPLLTSLQKVHYIPMNVVGAKSNSVLQQSACGGCAATSRCVSHRAEIDYFHAAKLCNGAHPSWLCSTVRTSPFNHSCPFLSLTLVLRLGPDLQCRLVFAASYWVLPHRQNLDVRSTHWHRLASL